MYSLVPATGIELTGLSENLIAAKQKFDSKLKKICNKKHSIKKTGISLVLNAARISGMITALEKEFQCLIRLPAPLENDCDKLLENIVNGTQEWIEGIAC